MRILLTGGGTAGHINPAIAIASIVKANEPDSEIAFVGTEKETRNDDLLRLGYPIYTVKASGIQRSLSPSNIKALYRAVFSPYYPSTRKILHDFKPDIVVGTGGYACWPILVAAAREGIPTAVHESNALPGMAVRRLQNYVDRVFINFAETADLLKVKNKTMQVGNPLRDHFGDVGREDAKEKLGIRESLLVISFGGSLGAQYLTDAVLDLMKNYTGKHPEIRHIHATGKTHYDEILKIYRGMGLDRKKNLELRPYIDDMPYYMAASDVVICRAGAMTTSELALTGRAAVMVPSPYVAENHQYRNAKALCDKSAVTLVQESELSSGKLIPETVSLLENPAKRAEMERNIRTFAVPDANRRIYEELRRMVTAHQKAQKN